MTDNVNSWGYDLVVSPTSGSAIGLESLGSELTQSAQMVDPFPYFNPAQIAVSGGVQYATIYVCRATGGNRLAQQLAIWLTQLRETDQIKLTICSLVMDIPFNCLIDLMAAFASTKAKVIIQLDQVVTDSLAYFYLIADEVQKGTAGSLYIPPYSDQRAEDASGPTRAISDFHKWVVDSAVEKNWLTPDEAVKLHSSIPVVVPEDRFTTT